LHFGGIRQARKRGLQNVARSDDYAALDEILELANIARPLIRDEGRHRFRGNVLDLLVHPAGIDLDEILGVSRFSP